MTVCIDTLDIEGSVGPHVQESPALLAPASSVAPDDRPDPLASLVETHRPWAERVARGLLDRIGDIFDFEAIRRILETRTDIQTTIGMHGTTTHGVLEQLILDSARALSTEVAEA